MGITKFKSVFSFLSNSNSAGNTCVWQCGEVLLVNKKVCRTAFNYLSCFNSNIFFHKALNAWTERLAAPLGEGWYRAITKYFIPSNLQNLLNSNEGEGEVLFSLSIKYGIPWIENVISNDWLLQTKLYYSLELYQSIANKNCKRLKIFFRTKEPETSIGILIQVLPFFSWIYWFFWVIWQKFAGFYCRFIFIVCVWPVYIRAGKGFYSKNTWLVFMKF